MSANYLNKELLKLHNEIDVLTAERDECKEAALLATSTLHNRMAMTRNQTALRAVKVCRRIASEIDEIDGDRAFVTAAVVIDALRAEFGLDDAK